jgi:hypothetical protein
MTYTQLTQRIIALSYLPQSKDLAALLCDISRQTHKQGRGLLSAVVVHADDGLPGDGFFALGRELGFTLYDEPAFWKARLDEVHSIWRPDSPPAKM